MMLNLPLKRVVATLLLLAALTPDGQPCMGQDRPAAELRLGQAPSSAGVRRYSPDTWGIVRFNIVNPTDEPAEALTVTYFPGDPNLQYGRKLWVPPHSRRSSWYPVLPPADFARGRDSMEIRTIVLNSSQDVETTVKNSDGKIIDSGLLMTDREDSLTGFLAGGDDSPEPANYELAVAFRLAAGRSRRVSLLYKDQLPPVEQALDGLNELILSDNRADFDIAGLRSIRRWLHRGGRLWIMLDHVHPDTVRRLLGDTFDCQVVDRVGLTEFQIVARDSESPDQSNEPRSFETPVDLLRVVPEGVEVSHTVNGWPAAFWQRVGNGEVLFTTLGARGWMRERTAADGRPDDPTRSSKYVVTQTLQSSTRRFFDSMASVPLRPEAFKHVLAEQIGYRIAPRRVIAWVLGSFCAGLLLVGSYLTHRKRLDRLLWIGPLLVLVSAAVLAAVGRLPNQDVPNTLAMGQFIEAVPGSRDLHVSGLLSLYNRQASSSSVGAERGGVFRPDMTELGGATRRMVWTDLDTWHWENLSLPPGVRVAPFQMTTGRVEKVDARGRFGPNGFSGTLAPGPFREIADALIATSAQESLAVRLGSDGTFEARPQDVLAQGQFLDSGLLSDEQRRRQSIYQQLIPGSEKAKYPDQPTLLAWSEPLETGFAFPDQTKQIGSALLAIPLTIERTPPQTQVVIPCSFLPYEAVFGPDNTTSFLTYDHLSREWLETKGSVRMWLRFDVPRQVLPIKLDRATLTVHINGGPLSRLQAVTHDSDRTIPLAQHDDPVGTITLALDEVEVFQPDADGGLLLGIFVDAVAQSPEQAAEFDGGRNKWKIDYLRLEVSGKTLGH